MSVELHSSADFRSSFTHLEALGRSLAGLGPWLELDAVDSVDEEQARDRLRGLVREGLAHATHPASNDFMNFTEGQQPLVDAAFLAHGLLRSWNNVWLKLDADVQQALIRCLLSTRGIKPGFNNWLLFSAIIETFLCKAGADWDRMRIDYAIRQHEQWYKGDGAYGDGPAFHWDYYNSFVIQPMLYDIVHVAGAIGEIWEPFRERIATRAMRFAEVQERMIAPDGSFPVIGRSICYRFGAFQCLAQMALHHNLPPALTPAGIRCALTAVLCKVLHADGTFDADGWLRIGLCGHQPSIAESYITTGSLYLTTVGFLPLGLPPADPFWSDPDSDWTSVRVWSGDDIPTDHALRD